MLKHIPEFLPRGISPRVVLTFLVRLLLVLTLFFLSSTTIGIRDGRLFWSLVTEILCSRALLAASFSDKDPLSLSLLSRVILTGILDFFCRGGTWFWWLFFSGWSHEAIASHPRFLSLDENSYSNSVFFVVAVVVFWFSIVFNFFGLFQIVFLKLDCEIIQNSNASNLDTDRTDSWRKWFYFEPKSMETISYEFFVIQSKETFDSSCTASFAEIW